MKKGKVGKFFPFTDISLIPKNGLLAITFQNLPILFPNFQEMYNNTFWVNNKNSEHIVFFLRFKKTKCLSNQEVFTIETHITAIDLISS